MEKIQIEHPSQQLERSHPKESTLRSRDDEGLQSSFRALMEEHDRDGVIPEQPSISHQGSSSLSGEVLMSHHERLDPSQVSVTGARSSPTTQESPVNVNAVLGQAARDVQLASNGRDRFLLSFEVASGDLRGARIAVSSTDGVVSALAIPASTESTLRLEQALAEARQALESRGIDIGGMEVRTGDDNGSRQHLEEQYETVDAGIEARSDGCRRHVTADLTRHDGMGVDFFV